MKCEGIRISDSVWIWSVFKRESKCCALSPQPSRRYLCDPSDNSDLVLLKRYPSLSTSLHSLISSADPAVHCLPTCNVLRNWDFHNNKVISIGGETKKEKPALLQHQRPCRMAKITVRWGQLVDNGAVQGLKGRWLLTDGRLRVQEEG